MKSQAAIIDMRTPGAKEALAGWSYIDPAERAKWARKPDTRTLQEVSDDIDKALGFKK